MITYASIISISTHCTRLQLLDVRSVSNLKDAMDVLLHEMSRFN